MQLTNLNRPFKLKPVQGGWDTLFKRSALDEKLVKIEGRTNPQIHILLIIRHGFSLKGLFKFVSRTLACHESPIHILSELNFAFVIFRIESSQRLKFAWLIFFHAPVIRFNKRLHTHLDLIDQSSWLWACYFAEIVCHFASCLLKIADIRRNQQNLYSSGQFACWTTNSIVVCFLKRILQHRCCSESINVWPFHHIWLSQ